MPEQFKVDWATPLCFLVKGEDGEQHWVEVLHDWCGCSCTGSKATNGQCCEHTKAVATFLSQTRWVGVPAPLTPEETEAIICF